jgi:gas vesicle protein GvpK
VKKRTTRSPAKTRRPATRRPPRAVAAAPVTAADLRALRAEIDRRLRTTTTAAVGKQRTVARQRGARPAQGGAAPLRWNPEPEDVQRSVAQLVLTIVEFLRRLMERQAIRRMEQKTLTRKEVEAVGDALMKLEETIRDIGAKFGLTPEDLNLDLGPLGKLM